MTFEFEKNTTSAQFSLSSIKFDLVLDNKIFSGIDTTGPVTFEQQKQNLQHQLICRTIVQNDDSISINYDCTITRQQQYVMAHLQLEAFNGRKSKQFAKAKDCDAIDTPILFLLYFF